MALDDITKKIISDAEGEVKRILESAEKEIRMLEKDAEEEIKKLEDHAESTRTRHSSKIYERILSKARHDIKIKHDENLRSLIEKVFQKLEEKLLSLPEEKYQQFIAEKIHLLAHEKGTFHIPFEKQKETLAVIQKSALKNADTKIEDKGILLGGFIFSTKEKEYDFSFRSLLQSLKKKSGVEISSRITSSLHE